MKRSHAHSTRRGVVLLFFVLVLVVLIGMLALAIDIGLVAISRSQCQNAADSAAMAGARTINGDSTNNYNVSTTPYNAVKAADANKVLGGYVAGNLSSITTTDNCNYTSGNVTLQLGTYAYTYDDSSASSEGFSLSFPRTDTTEPYSAVRATVAGSGSMYFGRIFGASTISTNATAVAIHRPRDVFIIMDLSGSMRFQSLPGIPLSGTTASPSAANPRTISMNPETVYPQFGHYSNTSSAGLYGNTIYSTGAENVDPANISTTTSSGSPICADFYKTNAGVTPTSSDVAFTRSSDTYATAPGGYNYLKITGNTGSTYAATVNDIVAQTTYHSGFETNGYDNYVSAKTSFYTEGPGYWGKTFFIWPPDPRGSSLSATTAANYADNGAKDWRQRFFFKYNTSTSTLGWLDHNSILFNTSSPYIKTPQTTTTVTENGASVTYNYRINYAAIFNWLKNESPVHFPTQIRGGRIKYYDAFPDPTDTALNTRFWTTSTLTNLNERFWKSYVDFVLGLAYSGTSGGIVTYSNTYSSDSLASMIGNGDYFTWGTQQIGAKPDYYKQSGTINHSGGYAIGATTITVNTLTSAPSSGYYLQFTGSDKTYYKINSGATTTSITLNTGLVAAVANSAAFKIYSAIPVYMNYTDNPARPRHQFWFGPMTWVDWLGNYQTGQFWWPGNVHEAQAWACKIGISGAITDIQNNHPNDFIGMTFFSNPLNSGNDTGHHNRAVVTVGRNYQQLKDSLWFPPTTVTGGVTEITPYDTDMDQVPRANGGTAPGMGFMIAYNQLSSSISNLRLYATPTTTYRGTAGGLGRTGAQRIVIFETDGAPNTQGNATLVSSTSNSYYPIRVKDPSSYSSASNVEWPTSNTYSNTEVYNVVKQIVALNTASPPGYSTSRKPATVYPLGYGSLFDPSNTSSAQTTALTFMQTVAYNGGTASDSTGTNFPDAQRIYGTNTQRITRMQSAFTTIMQSGVQVSLIE